MPYDERLRTTEVLPLSLDYACGQRWAPCRIRRTTICSSRPRRLRGTGGEERRSLECRGPDQGVRDAGKSPACRCAPPQIVRLVGRTRDGSGRCNRRSVRDHPRRPSSSGRASPAISPIHASSDVIMLEQPALARRRPTLFDLGPEPLVVIYRAGQEVERHLVGCPASLGGQARQLHRARRLSPRRIKLVGLSPW